MISEFIPVNSVGTTHLNAKIDVEGLASAHSAESFLDRSSFVGLTWRPPRESVCAEIYASGAVNLPGPTSPADLLTSFMRILGEILRFSTASNQRYMLPPHLRDAHKPEEFQTTLLTRIGRAQRIMKSFDEAPKALLSQKKRAALNGHVGFFRSALKRQRHSHPTNIFDAWGFGTEQSIEK